MNHVVIEHFSTLDNYGTGMMGLVAVNAIARRLGAGNVEFYCDFASDEVMEEVRSELPEGVALHRYVATDAYTSTIKNVWIRRLHRLKHLLFSVDGRQYDMIIVLGGDDLSEYYGRFDAALAIFKKWKSSFVTNVVLLGQTIGPFNSPINRFAARYLLPRMKIFTRDKSCHNYLLQTFGVSSFLSSDLALDDLPLQTSENIVQQTLNKYGLQKDGYVTVIISACQSGGRYYCKDETTYIEGFVDVVGLLSRRFEQEKIVLLSHTFGRFGDETSYINRVYTALPAELNSRVVVVTDKVLQTRARAILGNGILTVTGRMHAAVSTLQMGRPAVVLSYSAKFNGVIGDSLGCADLIIEADSDALWRDGKIIDMVDQKIGYVVDNYDELCSRIGSNVRRERELLDDTLDRIANILCHEN